MHVYTVQAWHVYSVLHTKENSSTPPSLYCMHISTCPYSVHMPCLCI